ncbi:MAG: GNAT family N-acetyltransferase [Oscillospiraceae bacterium]|nr:GNAT family N-acetyltransferase [Oscillospiraceae bacterium]
MHLQNDKIEIRNAGINDAPQLTAWWNDGNVMAHAGFPNGLGTCEAEVIKQIEQESDDTMRRHIIVYDGVPIGEMNYRNLGDNQCEMGIKICDEKMQNRGIGKKVLSLFIHGLFHDLGYSLIKLDTDLKNERAQHVYEKLGFQKIRVNLNAWKDQLGNNRSSVDYELTKDLFNSYL